MMAFADDANGNPHQTLQEISQLCKGALGKIICNNTEIVSRLEPASFRRRLEECADSNEMYVAYEMDAISPPGMPPPERNLFVRTVRPSSPASRGGPQDDAFGDDAPSNTLPLLHVDGVMDADSHPYQRRQRSLQRFDHSQRRRAPSQQPVPHPHSPAHYDFFDDKERCYYAKGAVVGFVEVSHQPYNLGHFDLEGRVTVDEANSRPVVSHLVVAERARTSGIGSRLLEACEKHILEFWRMDELTVEVIDEDVASDVDAEQRGALSFFLKRDFDIIFSDFTYDSNNRGINRRVLRKFFGPMATNLKRRQEQKKREQQRVDMFGATRSSRQRSSRNTGTIVDVSFTDEKGVSYSFDGSAEREHHDHTSPSTPPYNRPSVRCDPLGLQKGIF
jgi:ribosomal protein S18 acetylase RimI-like enzyme